MTIALVFVSVSVVTPVLFAASAMDAFGVVLLMACPWSSDRGGPNQRTAPRWLAA